MLPLLRVFLLAAVLCSGSAFPGQSTMVRSRSSFVSASSTVGGDNGMPLQQDATVTAPVAPPKVLPLKTLDEFLDYLDNAPHDSLSVVKFYAKTCPLCRRIDVKYKKMAHFYQKAPIRFAEIDKAVHPDFCTALGVERFPFIQIYRNGQCVASHGTDSDKTFEPLVNDTVQRELSMSAKDWESFLNTFAEPIRQSTERVEKVRLLASQ